MKHLEKSLFVICLAFYAWGFIDERFRHWAFIGGYSTFMALITGDIVGAENIGEALKGF